MCLFHLLRAKIKPRPRETTPNHEDDYIIQSVLPYLICTHQERRVRVLNRLSALELHFGHLGGQPWGNVRYRQSERHYYHEYNVLQNNVPNKYNQLSRAMFLKVRVVISPETRFVTLRLRARRLSVCPAAHSTLV